MFFHRMKKILVLGPSGAGKSTLSRSLAPLLGLPLIHLDSFFWKPGWQEPSKDEWKSVVKDLLEKPSWIMDGNFFGTLTERLEQADTVIFLDLPIPLCLSRVFKRVLTTYNRVRIDLAPACPERFHWGFLVYVATFNQKLRPQIIEGFKENSHQLKIITLKSRAEISEFLYMAHAYRQAKIR